MDAHFEVAASAPKEARPVDRAQVETIGRRQESSEVEAGWEPRRAHV
jgi:hypothetical protein